MGSGNQDLLDKQFSLRLSQWHLRCQEVVEDTSAPLLKRVLSQNFYNTALRKALLQDDIASTILSFYGDKQLRPCVDEKARQDIEALRFSLKRKSIKTLNDHLIKLDDELLNIVSETCGAEKVKKIFNAAVEIVFPLKSEERLALLKSLRPQIKKEKLLITELFSPKYDALGKGLFARKIPTHVKRLRDALGSEDIRYPLEPGIRKELHDIAFRADNQLLCTFFLRDEQVDSLYYNVHVSLR